jgi:hypothetical protein
MLLRWTKKPAYVIWYRAESALMRVAIPPFSNTTANKKFYGRGGTTVSWDHRVCGSGRIYPKRHHEGVQDNDKQEFEEVCSILGETRHPIRAILPGHGTVDDRRPGHSHSCNKDIGNDPQRNGVKDESRQ